MKTSHLSADDEVKLLKLGIEKKKKKEEVEVVKEVK